jgi:hypothetical protein
LSGSPAAGELTIPDWLSRIEMLGTTIIVLLIGSMMIWYEAVVRGPRLALSIASAALVFVVCLVVFGRRSDPNNIAWWPFVVAGLAAAAVAELINAQFMVTSEMLMAGLTGVGIGTAQWTALRGWIRVRR